MKRNFIYRFLAVLFVASLAACCQQPPEPSVPVDSDPKVFIMYDNIREFYLDVEEAAEAVAAGALIEGQRLVVFERHWGGNEIYELVRDRSKREGYSRKTIVKYAPGVNNTFSKETLAAVVGDIRRLVQANHWAFAFGSHGAGWLPVNNGGFMRKGGVRPPMTDPYAQLWEEKIDPRTRFLGNNSNQRLDVSDFVDALDEWPWDFIIMDDCFMASIESLYEMRHLADYIIASPTEIMLEGSPYDRVLKSVFTRWTNLEGVVDTFIDYFKGTTTPYGTLALVKTSEIEALARCVRDIVHAPEGVNSVDPDALGIQFYDNLGPHVWWDLGDYMGHLSRNGDLLKAFNDQMKLTVVHKGHTGKFYSDLRDGNGKKGVAHPVVRFSGLAVFIPQESRLVPYYHQTDWYKDVWE